MFMGELCACPRLVLCAVLNVNKLQMVSAVMPMHFDHTCNQSLYSQPPVINNQDANFAMF